MTRRAFDMSFGARVEQDGAVRFRLWAPAAEKVELALAAGGETEKLPMTAEGDGWKTITTDLASHGSRYSFIIDGGLKVPDPASRYQPDDVHGDSQMIDPARFEWRDGSWTGRPFEEAVIYEMHVGTFTPEGTFAAAKEKLGRLADLGVTAVELMPVADFPGTRGWGYDGVYIFAPEARYGTPDDLKEFIQTAHEMGLMVFLDVVYNHFGPEGNYLRSYAPAFFTSRHKTPWGDAINFDGKDSRWPRRFFVDNALYWLTEYNFDGLRLDAVHAIKDDSSPDILEEIARVVREGPGASRLVHLVLENDNNAARYIERDGAGRPRLYTAQWNDDVHHVLHVLTTGEAGGYYADYADAPARRLGRCLAEGFDYQGEPSAYRGGERRGEPSAHLPPQAFVSFLQNHDQVGNRAFGERITSLASMEAVRAATAVVLLSPSPPLLFMGQEWGCRKPFLFFCDFGPELAESVARGRREEFSRFPEFSDPKVRGRIPDPNIEKTFLDSTLDWAETETEEAREWMQFHRELLDIRKREIVPRLGKSRITSARYKTSPPGAALVYWAFEDGAAFELMANLNDEAAPMETRRNARTLYIFGEKAQEALAEGYASPWSVALFLLKPPEEPS
ncbi:MAG: malto-oligosyltrehalose trehalohydrolase [Candidatus Nitrospinota bacterium M3_3B_026]